MRDVHVQELLRRVRRAHAQRGELSTPKQALTKDSLEAMLATCTDGLIGLRDRALLLFAWASGGRRRSEVTRAVMEQLIVVDANTYLYRLVHSKTDQAGATIHVDKPIIGVAAEALNAWLQASKITEGAIFRRIRESTVAEALEPQAVRAIVKRRAALAGLEGDFSAHSLRSGYMTEAGRQNVALAEAMALTGHRSVQTALRYFQTGAVEKSQAGNLLGSPPPARELMGHLNLRNLSVGAEMRESRGVYCIYRTSEDQGQDTISETRTSLVGRDTFIEHCIREAKKPATIRRYVATIARAHIAADLLSPCASEPVRLALKEMGRVTSSRQCQALALGWKEIKEFIKTAGEGLRADREKALLCVAYDTMARRSELVAFDVKDVEFMPNGSGTLLIRRSKTDAAGEGGKDLPVA